MHRVRVNSSLYGGRAQIAHRIALCRPASRCSGQRRVERNQGSRRFGGLIAVDGRETSPMPHVSRG